MAQKAIREYDAKRLLAKHWAKYIGTELIYPGRFAHVGPDTDLDKLKQENPWLGEGKLACKPDQLVGKRGKHGLIKLDATYDEIKAWLKEMRGKEVTIGKATDKLTHFIIEPFLPQKVEYYVAIKSERFGDNIHFSTMGGVDIEENWDSVITIPVDVGSDVDGLDIEGKLPADLGDKRKMFAGLIKGLYRMYLDLNFAFLEFNPIAVMDKTIVPLDTKARIDDTAAFECQDAWGELAFPSPFGRKLTSEEKYIKELDESTGASLKLTVLNPKGRVWTMVAGGGASVVYADTIVDLGFMKEMANYGEYSGDPSTEFTYKYAKTILDLMTREKDPRGKVLLIGGGIANFTDVAKTFTGIIQALKEYKQKLQENDVKIYVRRGGPNYQEGLRKMRELGESLGVPIEVYGPETHMTRIVAKALKGGE